MPTNNLNIPKVEHYGRPVKRNLGRLTLAASPLADVARVPFNPEPVQRRGPGAYSASVNSVNAGYQYRVNAEHR